MNSSLAKRDLQTEIAAYWNERIHDLEITTNPPGSAAFFRELDEYRFEKLHYLPVLVDFSGFQGKKLLEVGCGVGTDLVRFARGSAVVTGVDLSATAIDLARQNFAHAGLPAQLEVMDGEELQFADNFFDAVYAHGVIQYAANAGKVIDELYRVLKPGGRAILMVYNRHSWLLALSRFAAVELEHEDAPVLRLFSIREFREMLRAFSRVEIVPERFPVPSRLQKGPKAMLYNELFVPAFNALPRAWIRRWGWHLMAFATKAG